MISNESSAESVEEDYYTASPASKADEGLKPSATSTQSIDLADAEHVTLSEDEKVSDKTMVAAAGLDITLTNDNADQLPGDDLDVVDFPPLRSRSPRKLFRSRMVKGNKPSVSVIKTLHTTSSGRFSHSKN